MEQLEDRVAVVTGAASGIGRALARQWAAAGMRVMLADVDDAGIDDAVRELTAEGADAAGVRTDVSDPSAVDELAAVTIKRFGGVHLVCNNAGVSTGGRAWELSHADWSWVLGVNLFGAVNGIRTFVPHLVEQGFGHVVNTSSIAAFAYLPNLSAYNASKAALVALSETLSAELAETAPGVGVTVLCPGSVNTRIYEADRNRPGGPEATEAASQGRDLLRQVLSVAMDPSELAALAEAAVRSGETHLFTGDNWLDIARNRAKSVLDIP